MAPKGNRTSNRTHRNKVGGPASVGTVLKAVRLSQEQWQSIQSKIGKGKGAFSAYVRYLVESDLKK